MIDIKQVKEEAEKEFRDEQMKKAKEKIKAKLKEKDNAKRVLANIERELDDLYIEIGQDS